VKTLFCVSVSEMKAHQLQQRGPRRDFVALAQALDAELLYSSDSRVNSVLGKVAGPHVRQALRAGWTLRRGDACFADGEHVGIPLAMILGLTGRRSVNLVMLGHYVDRPWKRRLLRIASRVFPRGTLVLHSATQRERVQASLGRHWRVALVPYQVDTTYWAPRHEGARPGLPLILSVGSENRDYETLVEAARGLDAQVVVAAGSHWARRIARAGDLPPNVEYLSDPLAFDELREAYARACVVAVPLNDVTNQSGVTVILEAMSMARPVVATATAGQRECIRGDLVGPEGEIDSATTADRGPQVFADEVQGGHTGYYVPPKDADALRVCLERLINSPEECGHVGNNAREAAQRHFNFERFVETLAALLRPPTAAKQEAPRA
jgi:glycosyltransferase involved in cell wall biosynthesis